MTGATWRYAPQVRELISRFEDANQELNRYRNDESAASQMHRDLSAMSSQLTEALARAGILCDENTSLLEQVPHACHAPATRLPRACHAPATAALPSPGATARSARRWLWRCHAAADQRRGPDAHGGPDASVTCTECCPLANRR